MVSVSDPPLEQIRKLRKINDALMARVERSTDISGSAFALFQTAISLENEVRTRTHDLQTALSELSESNSRLEQAHSEAVRARRNLADAIEAVQEGFGLFDSDDTMVLCNQRFRMLCPDVSEHMKPGLSFNQYVRLVSESAELDLAPGKTAEDWLSFRVGMHGKPHATFTVALKGDRWIQVSERHTANGATAILQTDVTDMVRRERRERDKILDRHARLARATLDHMSQGVCTFDADMRLADYNTRFRALLNLSYDLVKPGTSLRRVVDALYSGGTMHSDLTPSGLWRWVARRQPRPPIHAEYRRIDGMIIDIRMRDMPGGGFVASFTDVTSERRAIEALHKANETLEQRVAERTAALTAANEALTRENTEREQIGEALREAKEDAEAANMSKTRFLAAASHDLLQPMNAAKLFISTLGEMKLEAPQAEVLKRLSGAFTSIETLLHALLEISRLDAGGAEFTKSNFAISTVLEPLEQEFKPLAAAKGLKLRVRPSKFHIRSDPRYFRRIAQNLVANAVTYTRSGSVLVGCRQRGDAVRFEVWDTGPGLKPEDHDRIFEEFQRLDDTIENRGMGLGLSIVKRSCRLLDLPLGLRSEPGRGSVFHVDAPIAPIITAAAPELIEGEAQEQSSGMNLIAAVVENEPEVLYAMTTTLEGWGASVAPALSTNEACAAIADLGLPPDIIIADYHLNGEDTGLRSIRELRSAWGANIPAVLVTADRSAELAATAREMGVDVLPKPVEPRKLRSLITWRGMATV
ncbi:PAS-domain containing protein [Hwanghaeella sp.]|uniref:hybrid sensor histidine kinase/response regulator n=1 Tax=Hwanghaeella sp. TaxID=2605943 RepID=UPI003CCBF8EF